MVKLQSKNGPVVDVAVDVAKCSRLISNLLEDLVDDETQVIPLFNVEAAELEKFIDYATHHKDKDGIADSADSADSDNLSPKSTQIKDDWDRNFIDIDRHALVRLVTAASYMDAPGLLQLCCKKIADLIVDRSVAQIREDWGITNDLGPEEEAKIAKENAWWTTN